MHLIEDVLISDEVWEARFSCDLNACKGVCCKYGDLGAGLLPGEPAMLAAYFPKVAERLPRKQVLFLEAGLTEIHKGKPHIREMGPDLPCPLSCTDAQGILLCSLHSYALDQGLPTHQTKPRWCRLFPLIVVRLADGWLINLHFSDHCRPAPNSPPILLGMAEELASVFGPAWVESLRTHFSDR